MLRFYRLLSLSLVVATTACGDDSTGIGDDDGTLEGSIVGRVEGTGTSGSSSINLFAGQGLTVAASRVTASGGLEALASASVAADGSYRIEGVPAGVARIVVRADDDAGEEAGRVIVHGGVSAGATATAAPMDGETTVEAHVFGELVARGMPAQAVNTVELAQSIEIDGEATADAVVASTVDLRAIADGAQARQEVYTQVLAELGITAGEQSRFEAGLQAAAEHAAALHAGADEEQADAAFDGALITAYAAAGVNEQAQVQASSAGGTGMLRASASANANARLGIAEAAMEISLLARERQTADALVSLGVPASETAAAAQAFAQARAQMDGAASIEAMEQAAAAAAAQAEASFMAFITSNPNIPQSALDRIQQALDGLPGEADLESRLAVAASASAVAEAYVSFFADLRTAVFAAVSELAQAGGSIDGQATGELFTSLRGRVQAS